MSPQRNKTSQRPPRTAAAAKTTTASNITNPYAYLYTALYDVRDGANNGLVRMYGVNTEGRYDAIIYCYFQFTNSTHRQQAFTRAHHENLRLPDRKVTLNGLRYYSSLFQCRVPRVLGVQFTSVTLLLDGQHYAPISAKVDVLYPQQPATFEHDFGVCVVAQFGFISNAALNSLVEWFEFNRLLGVGEFNIYDGQLVLDNKIAQLFSYYTDLDVLKVHKQPPPFNNTPQAESVRLLVYTSLNDCLYRNMFRYRYLVPIDLDEIIVPTTAPTLLALMQSIDGYPNVSVTFNSRNYFKDYPRDVTQPDLLPTMQHRNFSANKMVVRPKVIHNPRLCPLVTQHKCHSDDRRVKVFNKNKAKVHHYRTTCVSHDHNNHRKWSAERCAELAAAQHTDDDVLRFKDELLKRVQIVHKQLNSEI